MPQIEKGGKYIFGWSVISEDNRILIPEEAQHKYQLTHGYRVILIPGSKTSGGFCIAKKSRLEAAKLSDILMHSPDLTEFRIEEGKVVNIGGRSLCWTTVRDNGQLLLSSTALHAYGLRPGDHLLVVRGSYVGIGMAVKGPLVEEARNHLELAIFHPPQ